LCIPGVQMVTDASALSALFLFSVIMPYPDDKSMTKIGGDVHIPVTSERYTTATHS
jgi:hypothetical protein